ncbi:MAG: transglycosylase domain-containing protein [Patescibacteria group bacterium]|nr:transglycosylase domain-containing protein [Patescibacteria group bacterium]
MRYKVGIASSKFGSSSKRRKKTGPQKSRPKSKRISTKSKFKYRKIKKYSPLRRKSLFGKKQSSSKSRSKFKAFTSKAMGVILGTVILLTITGTVFVGATLANISASLPDPDKLIERASDQSTKIYDRNGPEGGVLLYTIYGDQNREFIKIDQVPEHTKWALLAAEDVEFYDHKGIDLPGIAKAAYQNLVLHDVFRGASTISQQLVRNTLLYDFMGEEAYERTMMRKIKEILITMQLEQSLAKDEILQMYMNEIALGGTNYGFQTAAKAYYGKDISELTMAESAMLAGLIQAPSYYSPLFGSNPEEADARKNIILDQMYNNRDYIKRTSAKNGEELDITQEMFDAAKSEEIAYNQVKIDIDAPHFVFYVKQQLVEEYGLERVERGGLKVTTTLDFDIQQIAEEEIRAGVDRFRAAYNINNGSMIVMDPRSGQIHAMVGSYDYWAEPDPRVDGNVNVAIQPRQMGSSVKPYTYLTAIKKGYGPTFLAPDIKFDFGYEAHNWDEKYRGLLLARQALVESRNISALYTLDMVGGVDEFIKTAEKLGITSLTERERYGLSITLGAAEMQLLEHTAAFGTFANGGRKFPTTAIIKVETSDGEVLQEWSDEDGSQIWDEKEIYLLNWMICDLAGQGRMFSQYYSAGNQRFCGKTGTTDGPRDLTTMLYYPNLMVGVWTGNNNNEVTIGAGGQGWSTTVPLPIAHSFMSRVVARYGEAWYTRPAGIVSGAVCGDTGLLAKTDSECTKLSSVFIQGHLPPIDDAHQKLPICKETGKVATNEDDANAMGLVEYKTFLKITLPIAKHQAALDAYLRGSSTYGSMASIPDEDVCPLHLGESNAPLIEFTSPASGAKFIQEDVITITVSTKSLHGVNKVEYFFDDSSIGTNSTSPFSTSYTIPGSVSEGTHTLSATVTDKDDKTGEASISIKVTSSPTISLSITSPSHGATVSKGTTIITKIAGDPDSVTNVSFKLKKKSDPSTSYNMPATKTSANIWTAEIPLTVDADDYTLSATASTTTDTYASSAIDVTVE